MKGSVSFFVPAGGSAESSQFHNYTVDLEPGKTSKFIIKIDSTNPDLSLNAVLTTETGKFIFGFYTSTRYDQEGDATYVVHKY